MLRAFSYFNIIIAHSRIALPFVDSHTERQEKRTQARQVFNGLEMGGRGMDDVGLSQRRQFCDGWFGRGQGGQMPAVGSQRSGLSGLTSSGMVGQDEGYWIGGGGG